MTGVWGLDQVGVFKGASKNDMARCSQSIRNLRRTLFAKGINPRDALKFGILAVAEASTILEQFQTNLVRLENLTEQMQKIRNGWSFFRGIARSALAYDNVRLVYHSEMKHTESEQVMIKEGHYETVYSPPPPNTGYGGEAIYESEWVEPTYKEVSRTVVDRPAWIEVVPVETEPGVSSGASAAGVAELQHQLVENIAMMQISIAEKSGVVFTSGTASIGLEAMLTQIGVPVSKLTNEQMTQLSVAPPEMVEAELQKIATDMKVDIVRLCKLQGEAINTVTTEVVEINPAEVNARIAEILKRFGISFDDSDPTKLEAARKAYEAASALATGL